MARSEGVDPASHISYVRLFLFSPMMEPGHAPGIQAGFPFVRPALTGQCTRDEKGKLGFELFANFGGVTDTAFYPPWQPTPQETFAPSTPKVKMTMEFLGYTRVTPFKRQFEAVLAPGPAQLRYVPPGSGSSNLEPPGWFFRYLRSLPTLRLSANGQVATFETAAWLQHLHAEPMCAASGA